MAKSKSHKKNMIFQIKISLKGIRPLIWRRVLVPTDFTLHQLHLVIQAAMGWDNYHLYSFDINGQGFSLPDEEGLFDDIDSRKVKLDKLLSIESISKMTYEYDFGDSWDHNLVIEKVLPKDPEETYPKCIAGKRACPPEDCGGTYGYYQLLKILSDPSNEEYEETKTWAGEDFDPEKFDIEETNELLKDYDALDFS
ncbi:MAG: plasmid pRiA4b ORF-3 family protein [Thermoplasmata archaeon]